MANDRLFLVCKTCGKSAMFFRYYPGPYHPGAFLQSCGVDPSAFVEEHVGCSEHAGDYDLGDDACFEVMNENHMAERYERERRE